MMSKNDNEVDFLSFGYEYNCRIKPTFKNLKYCLCKFLGKHLFYFFFNFWDCVLSDHGILCCLKANKIIEKSLTVAYSLLQK